MNQIYLFWALGIIGSYLLGSLSSAIIVCRLFRLPDPRLAGSHNPGTTNVLRLGGKLPAALTLLGDLLKGLLPVAAAHYFVGNPWLVSAVFFAAVVGHLYPVFFGFKGGKGVATFIGGIFGLSPLLGAIFVLTWFGIFVLTRYSSLSAIIAIITMPFWIYFRLDRRYMVVFIVLGLLILWRHRDNIVRLCHGKESKFKR